MLPSQVTTLPSVSIEWAYKGARHLVTPSAFLYEPSTLLTNANVTYISHE